MRNTKPRSIRYNRWQKKKIRFAQPDLLAERNKSERVYCHDLGFSADRQTPKGPLKKASQRKKNKCCAIDRRSYFLAQKANAPSHEPFHSIMRRGSFPLSLSLSFLSSPYNSAVPFLLYQRHNGCTKTK